MSMGLHSRTVLDPALDERLEHMLADIEAEDASPTPDGFAGTLGAALVGAAILLVLVL